MSKTDFSKIEVNIDGVPIEVDLTNFGPGSSFFIPCLNLTYGRDVLRRELYRRKFKVKIRRQIEDKNMGLRVWYRGASMKRP